MEQLRHLFTKLIMRLFRYRSDDWERLINKQLEAVRPVAHEANEWATKSIFHIPGYLKVDMNTHEFYYPQTVSFGPYHHGRRELIAMESHKQRALIGFLHSHGKQPQDVKNALLPMVDTLMQCYENMAKRWHNKDWFLEMMICDGCFMIEILKGSRGRYPDNDPAFGINREDTEFPRIRKDMLMIENQIPILVIKTLLQVANGDHHEVTDQEINDLILRFTLPTLPWVDGIHLGTCLHVLDVVRKRLLHGGYDIQPRPAEGNNVVVNIDPVRIKELHGAGIQIRIASDEASKNCLKYIRFEGGILDLPVIIIDNIFEPLMLNMMAFERVHGPLEYHVNAYFALMTSLIGSYEDVRCLQSNGVIISQARDIVGIFERLGRFEMVNRAHSQPFIVRQLLNDHFRTVSDRRQRRCSVWYRDLRDTYCATPWSILKVVTAALLILSALAGLVFTATKRK